MKIPWSVFHRNQKDYRIQPWGIQYFQGSVDSLLMDVLPNIRLEEIDEALIEEAFTLSGIIVSHIEAVV